MHSKNINPIFVPLIRCLWLIFHNHRRKNPIQKRSGTQLKKFINLIKNLLKVQQPTE